MNPCDALKQDWRMYYDGAWMKHKRHGPGCVMVSGNDLMFYRYPNDQPEPEPKVVLPRDLECWWPRSGAYNTPGGAIYISRKSTRSMRKSAHPHEHYVIKWGHEATALNSVNLMIQLRKGHSFVELEFALKAIKEEMTKSVAITRDIILAASHDGIAVVFRGIKAGILEDGDFTPDYDEAPLARRVMSKLIEEGII